MTLTCCCDTDRPIGVVTGFDDVSAELSRSCAGSFCGVVVTAGRGTYGGADDMLESGDATSWNGRGESFRDVSPDL